MKWSFVRAVSYTSVLRVMNDQCRSSSPTAGASRTTGRRMAAPAPKRWRHHWAPRSRDSRQCCSRSWGRCTVAVGQACLLMRWRRRPSRPMPLLSSTVRWRRPDASVQAFSGFRKLAPFMAWTLIECEATKSAINQTLIKMKFLRPPVGPPPAR